MAVAQEQFWSRVAPQYDTVVDAQLGTDLRRLVLERVAEEHDLAELVELGCGSGFFTKILAERALSVVATDIAGGMLDIAKTALAHADNVRFQVEDCQKTSFADAAFDTAFMSLVLQFVETDTALREMHRILRPDGTLLIAHLDVHALRPAQRLRLILRTLYYAAVKYRTAMPRVSPRRMVSGAELCRRLEAVGFKRAALEYVRDPSCAYNCPVAYVRARKG